MAMKKGRQTDAQRQGLKKAREEETKRREALGGPHSDARKALLRKWRRMVAELLAKGLEPKTIVDAMRLAAQKRNEDAPSTTKVMKLCRQVRARWQEDNERDVEELRAEAVQRLNMIHRLSIENVAIYDKDGKVIGERPRDLRAAAIVERQRHKLLGLEKPRQVNHAHLVVHKTAAALFDMEQEELQEMYLKDVEMERDAKAFRAMPVPAQLPAPKLTVVADGDRSPSAAEKK